MLDSVIALPTLQPTNHWSWNGPQPLLDNRSWESDKHPHMHLWKVWKSYDRTVTASWRSETVVPQSQNRSQQPFQLVPQNYMNHGHPILIFVVLLIRCRAKKMFFQTTVTQFLVSSIPSQKHSMTFLWANSHCRRLYCQIHEEDVVFFLWQ